MAEGVSLEPASAETKRRSEENEEERTFISGNSEARTSPPRPEQATTPSPPTALGMELSLSLSLSLSVFRAMVDFGVRQK